MKKVFFTFLSAAFLAGSMLLTGCGSVSSTSLNNVLNTGLQALSLGDEELVAYSKQAVAQMDAEAQVAPSTNAYAKRLAKLTNGLTTVDDKTLNFKVYITNEVNAFACPDGSVRVYSGIMDMMSDDELLGIVGHEIGHVAMKHSLNSMKQAMISSALLDAIGSTSAKAATLTKSQLGQLGEAYLSSSYSRKQENEADDFGYEFLKGAGKNPWAMAMAFEKMQQLEQTASSSNSDIIGSYLNSMFSDHPATADRIKRMTERAQKDGISRPN